MFLGQQHSVPTSQSLNEERLICIVKARSLGRCSPTSAFRKPDHKREADLRVAGGGRVLLQTVLGLAGGSGEGRQWVGGTGGEGEAMLSPPWV